MKLNLGTGKGSWLGKHCFVSMKRSRSEQRYFNEPSKKMTGTISGKMNYESQVNTGYYFRHFDELLVFSP